MTPEMPSGWRRGILLAPAWAWLIAFFLLPLGGVILLSFWQRGTYGNVVLQWTLDNYGRLFHPLYLRVAVDSVGMALATTGLALAVGYPLAYAIARLPRRRQRSWLIAVMLPFWINFLVRTIAWVLLLSSQGVVNTALLALGWLDASLPLLYNNGAVLLGMVYTLLPFMVLQLYTALEKMDWRLLEAAYDLGATPWQAFWHVTFPQTLPGVVAGCALVFVSALGLFVVPEILGGAKSALLGNLIQNQFLSARDWPFGAALSVFLMLVSLIAVVLYLRMGPGDEREVESR